MGDFKVRKIIDADDRRKMYQHALNDIETFERMLQEKMFDSGPAKIGAEQELCIVNQYYNPATSALKLLKAIDDDHYTNELALFNMEINLDPLPLSGNCFNEMESALWKLLQKGHQAASKANSHILMTGILPTLRHRHLQFDYMTPIERYQTISQALSEIRGTHFEIYLQGVDEFIMSLGSVLFEACNTSFQLHLQVNPEEFVDRHNWSQMIAGPVLSACVNSPMLFGNELWSETRIALFKQSLDTRSSQKFLREKLPRVYFGKDWLQNSPAELWKNDLMHFPLLVTTDDLQDSKAVLDKGEIPNLRGIRLHNGTTYTWNRMCYGFSKTHPHLRIECRYLPAGPSVIDEMANLAFWIGLMNAEPPQGREFWKNQDIKSAKNNFVNAARTGLNSVFQWYGENIPAKELLLDKLLPLARQGLEVSGVSAGDIDKYLSVFEKRVAAEVTGADWTVKNFRSLSKRFGEAIAEKQVLHQTLHYQNENIPLHEWKNIDPGTCQTISEKPTVDQLMSTDIFSVHEGDSIEIVKSLLTWNNIHHLPVEDVNGNLVGLITDGMIERLELENPEGCRFAKDIMLVDLFTIQAHQSIKKTIKIMQKNQLSGLPVVYNQKLVGIITRRDLERKLGASSLQSSAST
ncbi:MAG: CBS domain-containing protein [Saprospiraceae bacterium]|jgi:CBS domain-containing protein